MSSDTEHNLPPGGHGRHGFVDAIVRIFLKSNLPIILIVISIAIGFSALNSTPREEDPQIIVPMADVIVDFPGHSPQEVANLVATPLERILQQIDGVEYVYSMAHRDSAVITVRFYVGQDRERSLVKIFKKIDEHKDIVPPGVRGWTIKPVEIDDVPIVTFALTQNNSSSGDEFALRRVAEEFVDRLAATEDISRAYVVGGRSRTIYVRPDVDRMNAFGVATGDVLESLRRANVEVMAGEFSQNNQLKGVQVGRGLQSADELERLIVVARGDKPVFVRDVATVVDGPAEANDYLRHVWGQASKENIHPGSPGTVISEHPPEAQAGKSQESVVIAIAKKKGTNAVTVAEKVLAAAAQLRKEVIPSDMSLIVTRNAGISSNEKVNELLEALAVALVLVVAVLTLGLGWREAIIVALAVPVVFGLTLGVNMIAGLTINRVTLFALILSLGLLVDDPIVDVENITRHFRLAGRSSAEIVMQAVSEIRPPLIAATLAVIVSFLPMFGITGMMGPYMQPMALNVPVTMMMSMLVAFTITPWLAHVVLRKRYGGKSGAEIANPPSDPHDLGNVRASAFYRGVNALLGPLVTSRRKAWIFLAAMAVAMILAVSLAANRAVPLKMLPFGNKDNLQVLLDFDEGTTLEQADAATRRVEQYLAGVPETVDLASFVGMASPMDFNGMVRHYYLRRGANVADITVNLVDRKLRSQQTHEIALRLRGDLEKLAASLGARLKIVESPPGPPVLSTVVAEVYGRSDQSYEQLQAASEIVLRRMKAEPGLVDVDRMVQSNQQKFTFVIDRQKAALSGLSSDDLAGSIKAALGGTQAGILHVVAERNPLAIIVRLPELQRSDLLALSAIGVKTSSGKLAQIGEFGTWQTGLVEQTIYHKNLRPVVYVTAETVGRAPAEVVLDMQADLQKDFGGVGYVAATSPRAVKERSYVSPGGGVAWAMPAGTVADFLGEGEWKMTIDVFRDMGIAFVFAMIGIYIILVAQLRSFLLPVVVMLAIPLTVIGIMPGFWLLNAIGGGSVGGFGNPIFFTATAMIGMIALAGIVTRSSIIIVDFIHLSLAAGRSLKDAIIDSCVVRLRPILLTAATAMLSALPIATDPIFSGLAWALIFGLLASTIFTIFVIPVVYWLIYAKRSVQS